MKKKRGYNVRLAVEKEIGRGKFKEELFHETIRHNNLQWEFLRSHEKIMKHEIIVRAFHRSWDIDKVLNLWGRSISTNNLSSTTVITSDQVDCVLLYEVNFEELIKMIIQMHNLKAFL